jgi:hypothetical protein
MWAEEKWERKAKGVESRIENNELKRKKEAEKGDIQTSKFVCEQTTSAGRGGPYVLRETKLFSPPRSARNWNAASDDSIA